MHSSQLSKIIEPILLNSPQIIDLKSSYLENKLGASNNLLNFGQPILILCTKIIQGHPPKEISILKLTVKHEINIFINKCKASRINSFDISIAHYVLISTVKDILTDKDIEFDTLEHKQLLNEPFVDILACLLKSPQEYIELLELLFICYKFGFKDNYLIDHYLALENQNQIYSAIRQIKGKISKNLYDTPTQIAPVKVTTHKSNFRLCFLLGIISLFSIITASILINQNINLINHQVTAGLNNITQYLQYE